MLVGVMIMGLIFIRNGGHGTGACYYCKYGSCYWVLFILEVGVI